MDYERLHPDDIRAIASEVVRQLRQIEESQMDQAHLVRATTPKERNAMAREQRRRELTLISIIFGLFPFHPWPLPGQLGDFVPLGRIFQEFQHLFFPAD